MTQAMRFNVAAVLGLLLMFAGAWRVFGWGAALLGRLADLVHGALPPPRHA
jgi:hypothetical protein